VVVAAVIAAVVVDLVVVVEVVTVEEDVVDLEPVEAAEVIAEAVVAVVAEHQEEGAVPHAVDAVVAPAQEAEQRLLSNPIVMAVSSLLAERKICW